MSDDFNSNIGNPGAGIRPGERWFNNITEYSDDTTTLINRFNDGVEQAARLGLSRSVVRTVAGADVVREVQESEFADDIEIALPLSGFTNPDGQRPGSWYIYMARNDPSRAPLRPVEVMIKAADSISPTGEQCRLSAEDRVALLRSRGFSFVTGFNTNDIEQVSELWDPVFENWGEDTVGNLGRHLAEQQDTDPKSRTVWFSAVKVGDQIANLAMAEMCVLETDRGPQQFIESTEWLTRPDQNLRGHHLMSTNLGLLNARIAHDLDRGIHGVPLIFAECNDSTSSYLAGRAAGFRTPYRNRGLPAPQINRQNVRVHDGQPEADRYRDFHFTYVSRGAYNTLYTRTATTRILNAAGIEA